MLSKKHDTEGVGVGLGLPLTKQSFTTLVHGSNTSKFQVMQGKNAAKGLTLHMAIPSSCVLSKRLV